jgi:hypothetical protein
MLDEERGADISEKQGNESHDLSPLFEVTAVNFPYPILLTRTNVGDVLQLQLHPQPEKKGVLVLYQDQVAGYISLHDQSDLFASLQNGGRYEAVLSENYGGHCRVLIRPCQT